jgi:protein SCO1/2
MPRLPVAAVLAAVLAAAACGGTLTLPESPADAPAGTYEIRGTVVSIDAPRLLVEIDQEAIPGVMPAMTMPYEVVDAGVLTGLRAGDRVHGTLRVDSRGYVITSLQRS